MTQDSTTWMDLTILTSQLFTIWPTSHNSSFPQTMVISILVSCPWSQLFLILHIRETIILYLSGLFYCMGYNVFQVNAFCLKMGFPFFSCPGLLGFLSHFLLLFLFHGFIPFNRVWFEPWLFRFWQRFLLMYTLRAPTKRVQWLGACHPHGRLGILDSWLRSWPIPGCYGYLRYEFIHGRHLSFSLYFFSQIK